MERKWEERHYKNAEKSEEMFRTNTQGKQIRDIFETAQKMKNGTIKPAKVYASIEELENFVE